MWRWLGRFRCARCGRNRPAAHRALRSPLRPELAICRDCLETWARSGHRCARCWMPIPSHLDVGLLVETGRFVHVDCGGARLLPAEGRLVPLL